jgi:pyrroline-5-carboxylate reductase
MFDTIGFLGGGNMGEALIKGLLSASLLTPGSIHVFDTVPARMEHLASLYSVRAASGIGDLAEKSAVIVLAVKPQVMPEVLKQLREYTDARRHLVVSIAAGIPLSALMAGLPDGVPIVRVMPNTPALVLKGASALSRGIAVSDGQMKLCFAIFQAVGTAVEVDEKWMDAVTGLSGSGPAYVLLAIEALTDGGVLMGIPRNIARELAVQTFLGTAAMVAETGKHPAELKDMITSPGGTTITGLKILEKKSVRGAFMKAVEAAALRSKELGKG